MLLIVLPLLAVATLPWYARFIPVPSYTFDLDSKLTPEAKALVKSTTITARTSLSQSRRGGVQAIIAGRLFDWPYRLKVDVDYSLFTLSGDVDFDFELTDTAWRLRGSAEGSPLTWKAVVSLPEIELTEHDAVIGTILSRLDLGNISELAFSSTLKLKLTAEKTRELPVPVWMAVGSVRKASASGLVGALPFSLENLSLMARAEGIADRVTIHPIMPRLQRIEVVVRHVFQQHLLDGLRADKSALVIFAGACQMEQLVHVFVFDDLLDFEGRVAGGVHHAHDGPHGGSYNAVGLDVGLVHGLQKSEVGVTERGTTRQREAYFLRLYTQGAA